MINFARTSKYTALYATVFGLFAFGSAGANAQLPANVENSALGQAGAGRVEDRLETNIQTPRVSPRIDVKDVILQNVPEGADKMCFALDTLDIEGINAYKQDQLAPLYADKLGQTICLTDLYAIATKLTNKYRNDGYILTQVVVPPQTIEGGKARLQVVEGYIDRVIVEGDASESELKLVRAMAARIQTGTALNASDLERQLLLINDIPGLTARSVLGPSPDKTGAADVRIIVERDPYNAYVGIDNYGSRYLGPVQLSAAGSLNSALGLNERITGQVVYAPNENLHRELAYGALSYEQPINSIGSVVEASYSLTDTEPGYILEDFDVRGRAASYTLGITHPFIRSRNENLYGHANFNWRDVRSSNNLEHTRKDRIRALRIGANYEFIDTFWRVGANAVDFEVSQGMDVFGASDKGDLFLTRTLGNPTFTKANLALQRLQSLTNNVNLLLKAKGQISNGPLLSSEEFGVGGMDIGRGYDASEIIGDEGMAGKVELQWNNPKQLDLVENYQLFTFLDSGRVWNDDATSSSTKTDTLTSAGLGVRADFTEQTQMGLAVAFPLNRDVETQGDKDPRFYLSLSRRF